MNKSVEDDGETSPTAEVVKDNITVQNDKLFIKDEKGQIGVNLDQKASNESYCNKYVHGNHQ